MKMRSVEMAALAACVLMAQAVAGKGMLPCMVYRRGLTNEQIDQILSTHPDAQLRITAQDWRGMSYQLYRFHNMTNYVEEIGNSNDCARVLLKLHDEAETLTSSNSVLRVVAASWKRAADKWRDDYAVATNNLQAALADYYSASNRAARAEARHDAVVGWCEAQRDKALLPSTKAIWQAIIDKLEEQ